jgi:arsenate reductase
VKRRVLFVCVGNAIRSQMAEGFARTYGFDCVTAASAGVSPAGSIEPTAVRLMDEIGIDISEGFPKHYRTMAERMQFDLIVNMSGRPLPGETKLPVREWEVPDPVGKAEDDFRRTRDLVQKLTLKLVAELRTTSPAIPSAAPVKAAPAEASRMVLDRRRRLKPSR